ncbi:MAG: peptidoglycan-binding domain-containing protein, partial [Alphaproteobacteria bacterium]
MGTMRPGSSGRRVRKLHALLRASGVYEGPDATVFSAETTDAVTRFQRSRKLPADGKAGPMTMIALYQSLADDAVPRLSVAPAPAVAEAALPAPSAAPTAEPRVEGGAN